MAQPRVPRPVERSGRLDPGRPDQRDSDAAARPRDHRIALRRRRRGSRRHAYLVAHLPAGPLVDRWNRRRILLLSELCAGLALSTVPVAIWLGRVTVAHLAVVAFVQGLCFVFFGLAERAALPKIVPVALFPTAIAHNEARSRGAALAGPPLGGALFGIDRAVPFMVDELSYVAASIGLLFIRSDLQNPTTTPSEPLWRATTTGLRWVWRHPLIRAAILLIAASNLVFQALILIIVVLAQHHGATSTTIGTMPLFAFTSSPLLIGAIGAACAFIGPLWNVVIISYATVLVPNEPLGRVTSAAMTLSWGVMPLASLGAGYLLTTVGPVGSVCVLATVMLVTAVIATVSPSVRHAPPLPVTPSTDERSTAH
ncbi:MFS transporter [Streptomyces cupreus]|uniref:MFS transporter n=1 Tax=Streptomyces cupreus TaxID=2759956 RepID=UPI0021B1E2F5|nr:MFS transporter [Streptomyces cupreus]